MQIRVGYELAYEVPQPTPMLLTVHIHYSRASDLVLPDHLVTVPSVPVAGYRDSFGNWISRIVAPSGQIRLSSEAIVNGSSGGSGGRTPGPAGGHRSPTRPRPRHG